MPLNKLLTLLLTVLSCSMLVGCDSGSDDTGEPEQGSEEEEPGPGEKEGAEGQPTAGDESVGSPGAPKETGKPKAWTPEGPTHPVFNLMNNRVLAHQLIGDGFTARMGAPFGTRYVRAPHHPDWAFEIVKDDRSVTVYEGRAVPFYVPLTAEQAEAARHVSLYIYNASAGQDVSISLNGENVGGKPLEQAGWQNVDVTIMPGLAKAGENEVVVTFSRLGRVGSYRAGGGIATLGILPDDLEPNTVDPRAADFAGVKFVGGVDRVGSTDARRTIKLAADAGLAWYTMVPTDGVLALEAEGEDRCALLIDARAEGGSNVDAQVLADGQEQFVDLKPVSDELVRLEIRADKGCTEGIVLKGGALHAQGEPPAEPEIPEPPKNVIVWLVDTLRSDHLPIYNPETDVHAPNFVEFAKTATVFETAYVEGNESKVSHSSLFTGLYPINHRHYRSSTTLKEKFEIIPEAMQRTDRATAGFISNGYISDKWGFKQGWDRYVNTIREGRRPGANNLLKIATPWLEEKADEPFFIYFGTIDPHVHYFRHEEFIDLYDPLDAENMARKTFEWKASGSQIHAIARGDLKVDEQDKARVKALYKNEITWNDKYFGKLLGKLDELGIRDETMIVVLADHGEEFWEHGGVGHARTLYQHTVQVPLMISYPPLFPPGKRVEEAVDILDIYPTLVKVLGIEPPPDGLQGGDLHALAHDIGAGYPRPTIATMGSRYYVWRLGDYKFHVEYDGEVRLFNVAQDWWEGTNLVPERKASYAQRWLQDTSSLFLAYRSEWDKRAMGVSSNLDYGFEDRL